MGDETQTLGEADVLARALAVWLRRLGIENEPAAPAEPPGGGEALESFTNSELEDESARRTVEARGTSLITTSSALATLAFAATALVTGAGGYMPLGLALWALGLTFAAFVAAAWCGLLVVKAEPTEVVTAEQLLGWRNNDPQIWENTKDNVAWLLTRAKILKLASLRSGSNAKMTWVKRGWIANWALLPD